MKMETEKRKEKSGVAILIPENINFKRKAIPSDKEGPSNPTSEYLPEEPKKLLRRDT